MAIEWTRIIEDAIIGKLVTTMVEEGYRIELCDQDGGGLFLYAMDANDPETARPPEGGYRHWVRLVPGNGPDVIVDHTTNLEKTLKPVNDFAAQFQQ